MRSSGLHGCKVELGGWFMPTQMPSEYNSKVEIAKLKIAGETHVSQIHRKEFLGGLLKSYYRKVA